MRPLEITDSKLHDQMYQILLEEMSAYDYLKETISNKQKAIVSNDVKMLEHLTGVEQVVVKRANRLTASRAKLMEDFKTINDVPESTASLSEIIKTVPVEKRDSWLRVNERLHQTVTDIQRKNAENIRLIESGLQFIRGTIELFLPQDEFSRGIYTEAGSGNKNNGIKNILDCNA